MKLPRYQDFIDELAGGEVYGAFVDDSGSPGLSSTPEHLHPQRKSWVAVVVPPHQMGEILHEFPRALGEVKRVTGATEFHFADIYAGRKEFAKEKVGLQVRLALFRFMAYIFTTYELPILVQTFDPETLRDFRTRGSFPDKISAFDLRKPQDAALFLLLIRIKWYLQGAVMKAKARVFVDEGYKKNGLALRLPFWESVFSDGLICFAKSSSVLPLQLADFAAFCLNRTQLLLGKPELNELDKELLRILTPVAWNYQNTDKHVIELEEWGVEALQHLKEQHSRD
jgi:hypothetical protein